MKVFYNLRWILSLKWIKIFFGFFWFDFLGFFLVVVGVVVKVIGSCAGVDL